jgi:deoxyadenosine/deoxycytidine kinase
MWLMVYGGAGTAKHVVVDLLVKRGYEYLKSPEPSSLDEFGRQLEYLVGRARQHLRAHQLMGRRDVLTVRSPFDTFEVYTKMLHDQQKITDEQFNYLKVIYDGLFSSFEPPHAAVWCHASSINALSRIQLREQPVDQNEFNEQLVRYKAFYNMVKVPQIEWNLDLPLEILLKDFEFNIASLRTTSVASQTLWQRSFYHAGI